MNHPQTTDELLAYDPLQAAEDLTGKHWNEDEGVGLLGLAIAMGHNNVKQQRLEEEDDTFLSNDLTRYTRIITGLGFEKVLDVPFDSPGWEATDPARNEHYYIYAHRELGLLLSFDTYGETSVNGGEVYYCWVPNDRATCYKHTSSGGMYQDGDISYWQGDHDCREALKHKLNALKANGTFLQNWPGNSEHFLWLLHHEDIKEGYDHEAITQARIEMLPDWVREMIGR